MQESPGPGSDVGLTTRTLFRIADLATQNTDSATIYDVMMHNTSQIVAQDRSALLVLEGEDLVLRGASGGDVAATAMGHALEEPYASWLRGVLEIDRTPRFLTQGDHPCILGRLFGDKLCACAVVPLWVGEGALGALVLSRVDGPTFGWEDERLLRPLAGVVSRLLESRRHYREMRDHARDLAEEHARVVEAHRVQREFLSNVSHELRTPLTGILGYAELLVQGEADPATVESHAATILDSGRRLLSLINRILDFSRLDAGRMEVHGEPTDLGTVCRRTAAALRASAEQAGLSLEVVPGGGVPEAWADPRFCEEIVTNLVGNALKFTERGRVTVEVRGVDARLSGDAPQRAVEVRVRDTGPGVAMENQQVIFEPFRQVDGSITRARGGTGLGLALCREMVDAMGGRIWIESAPGKGSTFAFLLPADPPAGATPAAEWGSPGDTGPCDRTQQPRGPVVSVALHDCAEQARVAGMLRDLGYEVAEAATGASLLSSAQRLRPRAVVCDAHLPDMNAWQIVGAMRASRVLRATPVLVCSPFASHTGVSLVDAHGTCVGLPSPVDGDRLRSWLESLLDDRARQPARLLLVGFSGDFLSAVDREADPGDVVVVRCESAERGLMDMARHPPTLTVWQPSDLDVTGRMLAAALSMGHRDLPPVVVVSDRLPDDLAGVASSPAVRVWPRRQSTPGALLREVRRLSETRQPSALVSGDPLTGLPGPEYMEHRVREEHARAERYGRPYSLMRVTMDDGEGALPLAAQRALAHALRRSVRACDLVARVGRGVFVVLLPEADTVAADGAKRKVQNLFPAGEVLGFPYACDVWTRDRAVTPLPAIDELLRRAA